MQSLDRGRVRWITPFDGGSASPSASFRRANATFLSSGGEEEEEGETRRVSLHFERNAGKPAGCYLLQMLSGMSDGTHLTTWVSQQTKQRFAALARQRDVSESALLKHLVELTLQAANPEENPVTAAARRATRISIRLRPDDQLLLQERARSRGMPAATYVSVLVRAHLRSLSPLPKEELLALRRAVSELGAAGRNLNQLARAANQGERVVGPSRDDLRALLKACESLRDHVKELLVANVRSWAQGYGEPQ